LAGTLNTDLKIEIICGELEVERYNTCLAADRFVNSKRIGV